MSIGSNALVTGSSFTHVEGEYIVHAGGSKNALAFEQFVEDHVVAGALHNSEEVSDQPKCHPGTRVAILDHLIAWATALTFAIPIIWLHGPAGAGKSAILRTIAQNLSAAGRNTSDHLIATIAYQLTLAIPATRQYIVEALERNPLLFSLSLWDQAKALIVSPLLLVSNQPSWDAGQFPRVIVIDGLDECYDPQKQTNILEVLCHILQELPIPFAILVASRPEHHIRSEFGVGDLNRMSSRLALDDSYNPDADIKKYLVEKFKAIQDNHPLNSCLPTSVPWPSQEVVDHLVAKASGQFIYVSTIDKFVSSSRHNPAKRLDMILGTISAGNLKPFEELDNLYSVIFSTVDPANLVATLRILGVLLAPHSTNINYAPEFIEHLLHLETGDVRSLLFDLESLLTIGKPHESILFFHASLGDYLFDRSRSCQFYIDAGMVYADIAQHCVIHLTSQNYWPEFSGFFTSHGFLIFSKAAATPALRQVIEKCDFTKIYQLNESSDWSGLAATFLKGIYRSAFPDAKELYLKKVSLYINEYRLK